jgi:hypothetical protein
MSAARTLADHNVSVTVFDKGRGPGGRASTRFEGEQTFDHGAQYFTARDPRFRRAVEAWVERGVVARWSPSLATIEKEGDPEAKASGDVRYVGVPGMHAVVRHLAETIGGESEVRFGRLVHRVERRSDGFAVSCDGREKEEAFDAVIVALPAPQASQLLRGATTIEPEIARVRMEPCWAVMLAFDERVPTGFDGLFVNDASSPLSWVSRDSSKPGRPAGERWVLHASPEWSREHIEMAGDEVAKRLTEAFGRALGVDPPAPKLARAHRWRYALGVMGDSPGMLFDRESMLAVAGDWCHGGRIEGAYLSGVAASGRLLGEIVARA